MGFWSLSALLVLSAAFAQSQPPSPAPSKAGQERQEPGTVEQTKSEADQKSAKDFSSLVDKVVSEITRRNQQQPSNKGFNPTSPDWWVAIFTGGLAIIGAIQVFVYCRQANFMRRGLRISIRQARIANRNAIAAKDSADTAKDTLIISQRASIAIHPISFVPPVFQSGSVVSSCIEFKIENTGQTIAKACHFHVQVLPNSPEQQIVKPTPLVSAKTDLGPRFPIGQITSPITELFNSSVNAGMLNAAIQRRAFRVVGFVRYKDIFDNGMYLAFRAVLNGQTLKFDMSAQLRPDGEQPDPDEDKLYG